MIIRCHTPITPFIPFTPTQEYEEDDHFCMHVPQIPASSSAMTPISPGTEASVISSFPGTIKFKRKPPPQKQRYNKCKNPFSSKRNSFEKRKYVLKGTLWDSL